MNDHMSLAPEHQEVHSELSELQRRLHEKLALLRRHLAGARVAEERVSLQRQVQAIAAELDRQSPQPLVGVLLPEGM